MGNPWWQDWVAGGGDGQPGHCAFCGHAQSKHIRHVKKEIGGVTHIVIRCGADGCDHVYGVTADKKTGRVAIGRF